MKLTKEKIFQMLPIVAVALFIAISTIFKIEWGFCGYIISFSIMAALVWFGFFKGKK